MPSTDYDVMVIGAGPVGCNTAALIAKSGYNVALVDRHPVERQVHRCGCLVTPRVLDIVEASKSVVAKIRGAEVFSPKGKSTVIDGGKTKAVVLDRTKFDDDLLKDAQSNGAEFLSETTARVARRQDKYVDVSLGDGETRNLSCKLLIGADGAASRVADWFSLSQPKTILLGCEQTMTGVVGDDKFVKLFLGRDFAPSFFGWIIPSDDHAKIGLCVDKGNVRMSLDKMMSQPSVKKFLKFARPLEYSVGGIPIGFAKKTYAANVMTVGDAACQVKATSGGGLFTGLLSSTHCANTATEALEADDFSPEMLKSYQDAWMGDIGKELRKDLAIHEAFARLNDKQMEEIFDLMNKPAILDIIKRKGDIDFPSKVGWALLKKEPKLLKYAGKALRATLAKLG